MAIPLMRFGPGRNEERRVFINVMAKELNEQNEEKKGNPVWLNEVSGTEKMLGHKATMFLNGSEPGKQWFEISGPIRRMDEQGNYLIEPRTDDQGNLLNAKGEQVSADADAAKQYVYVKDTEGKIVLGKLGTVNVVNTRRDQNSGDIVPTKSTYLSVKMYTDTEAYEMARTLYRYKNTSGEQQQDFLQQLNKEQKDFGKYSNMFVNEGAEHLKEMGFEVRVAGKSTSNTPSA